MKNILIWLFLTVLLPLAKAQEIKFNLKTGEEMRDKIRERTYGITGIGAMNGYSYFLFLPFHAVYGMESIGSNRNYSVGMFDKENRMVKKSEIVLESSGKELEFEGLLMLKDNMVVFSSFKNMKDKKHYLFAQSLKSKTLELNQDTRLTGELDFSNFSKFNNTAFTFVVSPDSTKVMFFYALLNKNGETISTGIYVFSQDMKLLWKKTAIASHFPAGFMEYKQFRLDNNGDVYLLGMHYLTRDNYYNDANFRGRGFFSRDTYFTDRPNYTCELMRFSENGSKDESNTLKLDGKFIRSINFQPSGGNKVLCTGMYSGIGKISVEGSFAFNYDISAKKVENLSTRDLGQELISMGFQPDELNRFRRSISNKQEWDPYNYKISELKTRQNGDKYFIAEQFIKGTKETRNGNNYYYEAIFGNNDLFVVTMGTDNQIKRMDKISKRQYSLNTEQNNSYSCFEANNNLYFVFNIIESRDKLFTDLEIGDAFMTRLDAEGNQKRTILRKYDKDSKLIPMFRYGVFVPDNALEYSLSTFNFKDYQFQQLTLNQ
jgi:hypothetical protein